MDRITQDAHARQRMVEYFIATFKNLTNTSKSKTNADNRKE